MMTDVMHCSRYHVLNLVASLIILLDLHYSIQAVVLILLKLHDIVTRGSELFLTT
jgi:hypothetical protein